MDSGLIQLCIVIILPILLGLVFSPVTLSMFADSFKEAVSMGIRFCFILLGIVFFFVGRAQMDENPDVFWVALVYLAIGIIWSPTKTYKTYKKYKAYRKERQAEKQAEKEYLASRLPDIGGTYLNRFFIECVLSGNTDFKQKQCVEKAKLFAQKYGLSYPNGIQALYDAGFQEYQAISNQIHNDRLNELRKNESELYNNLNKYSNYYGKDKRIAMLNDTIQSLNQAIRLAEQRADILKRLTQQPEHSWGWIGLADGIGGFSAGMAMALDVHSQNAEIRAQNQANYRAALPAFMQIESDAHKNQKKIEKIRKEIAEMQEKLISDESKEHIFKRLSVTNVTVDVSQTGAFQVTATVRAKQKPMIYDIPAIVDGTIVAHVFEDGKEIGTAKLVLPVNGVSTEVGVIGMGLSGANAEKKHTVTFTPEKLWLIEK